MITHCNFCGAVAGQCKKGCFWYIKPRKAPAMQCLICGIDPKAARSAYCGVDALANKSELAVIITQDVLHYYVECRTPTQEFYGRGIVQTISELVRGLKK